MSDNRAPGEPIHYEYPIVSEWIAPNGFIRCTVCDREVRVGQPYFEAPVEIGRDDLGEMSAINCVYCTTAGEPHHEAVDYFWSVRPQAEGKG